MGRWLVGILALILLTGTVSAIGISPSRISVQHATRGSEIHKTIFLSGFPEGREVSIRATGQAADWIRLPSMPTQDTASQPFDVNIAVPADAPNGIYSATLYASSAAKSSEDEPVKVTLLASVKTELTIEVSGTEQREFRITNAIVDPAEEGQPIRLRLLLDNTGNVLAAPEKIDIKIKDNLRKETLWQSMIDNPPEVKPFSKGESVIVFDPMIRQGQYWLEASALDDGKEVFSAAVSIDVAPKGSLKKAGRLLSIDVSDPAIGQPAKITCTFENTGERPIKARLIAEIYQKDWLLATQESDEMLVEPGETIPLFTYYTPKEKGSYKIDAHAYYEGKSTPILSSLMETRTRMPTGMAARQAEGSTSLVALGVIIGILFIGAIVIIARKK